jgi:hypothetical protein
MPTSSTCTKRFLLAAKYAELNSLKALASNCKIVIAATQMIHQLQRERGTTNVYLGSKGVAYKTNLPVQFKNSSEAEEQLLDLLISKFLNSDSIHTQTRLLTSITLASQGLEQLPKLRKQIQKLQVTPLKSTDAYCRLIGKIINLIFEAADVSSDASITKLLVALFNFIQGKELAGQERALGAIGFSQQKHEPKILSKMHELESAQHDVFERFLEFSVSQEQAAWQAIQLSELTNDINKLRTMFNALSASNSYTPELGEVWYEVATKRIDALQNIETMLTTRLMEQVQVRIKEADAEISNHSLLMEKISDDNATDPGFNMLFDRRFSGLHGVEINADEQQHDVQSGHKSFYDLICEQANHINQMSAELENVKRALHEQKVIGRAKMLLMQSSNVGEHQAHQLLQKAAMSQNQSLIDVANSIVAKVSKA